MDHAASLPRSAELREVEALDPDAWYLRLFYVPLVGALTRYHRCQQPLTVPRGPCVYVTHHGFGYLSVDIAMAIYLLGWQRYAEAGGEHVNVRTTIAISNLERFFPILGTMRRQVGGIDPREDTMVAALKVGQQILMTPGGRRECQPSNEPYALRWDRRFGFARTAIRGGAPIVPLATVGGHAAYPGMRAGKLSFWSPLPLPAKFQVALGDPIVVPQDPCAADDPDVVQSVQQEAWTATQALYDRLLAERRDAED